MARLSLFLLGPFQVFLADKPVTGFESARTRALLAYLAAESGRAHPRAAIAELLWPEQPHGVAAANLRHALATLRKTIADPEADPPCLLITHETLQFNPACDAFVDLARFFACAHLPSPCALEAAEEAANLYRGRFLEGFNLDGSPEFESWQVLTRERVDYQAMQVLARLVRHAVEHDDLAQAVGWTQRQLALEPWNEEIHQQLMWLLAHSGQRAAALHQYELCVRILAADQGVEPQPATQTLAAWIRAGREELGAVQGRDGKPLLAPASVPPVVRPVSTGREDVHKLPCQPTPFVGRARELAQIAANLANPDCRLLTIVGPGGVGKTRLAIEAARAQTGYLRDGIWFVDLTPASAGDMVPGLILRTLDAPDHGSGEARRLLLRYLQDKALLLVLDNFEHLLNGAGLLPELLAEALQAAPALKLLVTSRTRLNLRGEWLQPLAGLETPPVELDEPGSPATPPQVSNLAALDLDAYDATRLFVQCLRRLQPDFQPAQAEIPLIAHICHQLEGMPLGIELAASWTRVLSLSDLAAELEESLALLTSSLHDAPQRHRSMHVVFAQSWRQLSPRERTILAQLSVCRGGFTRSAAAAIAGATLPELASLVDKSWLRPQPTGRYVLHELTRQYCAERLEQKSGAPPGEVAAEVRRRHCLHYSGLLHEEMRKTNHAFDVMDNVMAEFGNLQLAWEWTVEHGDMQIALDMVISLYFVAEMLGWYHYIIRHYEAASARLTQLMTQDNPDSARRQAITEILIWLEYCRGNLFRHLGLLPRARASVDTSYALLESLAPGDVREQLAAFTEWLDTVLLGSEGEFDEAQRRCRHQLDYFRTSMVDFVLYGQAVGAKFWQAHALGFLAYLDCQMGNYAAAQQRLRETIALRIEIGEVRFRAFNHSLLARILELTGDYESAERAAHESLRLSQACGDQIGVAAARLSLGQLEAAQGHCALGREHCQHSLAVGRRTGHHGLLMGSLVALGRIELALSRPEAARRCFEEAIASFAHLETAHSNEIAGALLGLGWTALAQDDWVAAQRLFQETLDAPGRAAWVTMDAQAGLAQLATTAGHLAAAAELSAVVLRSSATAYHTRVRLAELDLA